MNPFNLTGRPRLLWNTRLVMFTSLLNIWRQWRKAENESKQEVVMSTLREELLKTLEDLDGEQFKRFKFFLRDDGVLDGSSKIPLSEVKEADTMDLVERMRENYQDRGAQTITLKILEKIGRNDLVERLRNFNSSPRGPGLGPTLSVSAPTPSVSAVEKLRSIRTEFIERVTEPVLRQLLDKLLDCGVVTDHEMESVVVIANRADKAREVIDTVRKKGEAACSDLIRAMCEVDPCLSKQLKLM